VRQSPTSGAVAVGEAGGRRLVVLRLGDREYGLATEVVVQVLRMVAVRPVPESPPWIAGVVNVRGRTTPMVDLRMRLGLPARAPDPADHIVVVRTGDRTLGLIVDAVLEVLEVGEGEVEPPADAAGPSGVVAAVARPGDRLILVLDVDRMDDRGPR
jgi:purine-binding chemotaxis protein CheW